MRALILPLSMSVLYLSTVTPARAILTRPDRSDEEYVKLASKYPASVCLNLPDGEATLIAPRWLLTAAHLAKDIKTGAAAPPISIGTKQFRPERVIVHPDFKSAKTGADLALVRLDSAVFEVAPVPVFRGAEEAGKIATIVGHGYAGTLEKGPVPKAQWDHKKRAATNKIERVIRDKWLLFVVDRPDKATDLEGAGGPGDSGGPAFIEIGGRTYVAGVSSFTDDSNVNGIVGDYGDKEAYTRVSRFADWIAETTKAE